MKLNKQQQAILIQIGLDTLLNRVVPVKKTLEKKATKPGWTPERREKFRATMKKKWQQKKQKLPNK